MVNVQATDGYEVTGASPFIRLSSSNLEALLDISFDALILISQDGIIVAANQQAEALFGYPRAQLLNQPLEQLLPERLRASHREHLVRYFSAPRSRPMGAGLSLFGLRGDGTEFPLDISLKTFLLDERIVAMADVHDMSTQRHLEEELAKTSDQLELTHLVTQRLAAIVESSGDAIFSKTLEGVITSWNRGAETLFGYRTEEIIGQPVSILLPPEHQQELRDTLAWVRLGKLLKDHEAVRVCKDGTPLAVSITISPIPDRQGRIIGSSTIARDITEHKRMERELARRRDEREQIMSKLEAMNQQLYGLFEHAPAGLVLFDVHPPFQVLLHNTFFQKFFPEPFYSAGMLGKYLPDFVYTAEEEGVAEVFREVVSTRQAQTLFNFVYDGMPRGRTWWNWHLAPIIKDGQVIALTQMVIETTHEVLALQHLETELAERRRAEDALRHSRDELVATNAALEEANLVRSQFLATMSHELRTPLASIVGFSEMLLDDAREAGWAQQQQSNLKRILDNSGHLLDLINDVLDLSKMEAGRMVVDSHQVDLRELLNSVVAEIQSLAIKRNLFLRTEIEEEIGYFETNPAKLHQILLNLVSNALKFTEYGGVTLSASRVLLSDEGAEGMAFAVQDSGIGISPDLQKRIFEAFYQADMSYTRKVGGTGLGLAIVSQLTELLGGTISVSSVPGQGSTFTVILPVNAGYRFNEQGLPRLHPELPQHVLTFAPAARELVPAPSPEVLDGSGPLEMAAGQYDLILAVDDNADSIVLIKEAMQGTPYTLIEVRDPLIVMELVQKRRPCAITLDVMMPDLNGWQLLHQLKENPATASIPVVMLTVLSERATGYVLGADDYLIKPFRKEMLRTILQRVIEASKREAQLVAGKD